MKAKKLERQVLEKIGKNWSNGSDTRKKLLSNSKEFARFLEKSYGLERIDNLKPRHIEAYVKGLHEKGLSASTMCGKMTAIRVICKCIGKPNIVSRENKEYGIQRVRVNPQPVNHEKLVEIRVAVAHLAHQGNRVAKMVHAADALREHFALRAKESVLSARVVERDGKMTLEIEGAKGGRPRVLPIQTEGQLRAVQLVAQTSKELGSGTGRIIPPELSLKQAYDAQRNLWRKLGGTRAVGANMHGERHAGAREMRENGASKSEIMGWLGHGEDRSPASYLGK